MILNRYPDYTKPGFNINAPCPVYRWPNMIIHNKTKNAYYPLHTGPLTIKFTLKGEEYFATKQRSFRVTPSTYLIFNSGQKYSARIQSNETVETISVFFRPQFAEEVLSSLISSEDNILDNEITHPEQPVHFMEILYPHDTVLYPFIFKFRMASKLGYDDNNWLEEEFYMLLKAFLGIHRQVGKEIKRIPAAKKSTKIEIYKRIYRAKDWLDENFSSEVKIEYAAKEACMSPFHFIRLFKNIFNETPYQYITRKRIDKAFDLILRTDMPITEVCFEIGFNSLSSFSWLLKQKYGMSPETMRTSYSMFQRKLAGIKK
ncbi:MAG: AraC family transcriptional regulator [Chlorobi bacterium]|nr:AraC family transcriptional regulator [Chlorobiota bacterium]MCI0716877.1 AraC family transcriptional regulator [Chlorobiota bacterium]